MITATSSDWPTSFMHSWQRHRFLVRAVQDPKHTPRSIQARPMAALNMNNTAHPSSHGPMLCLKLLNSYEAMCKPLTQSFYPHSGLNMSSQIGPQLGGGPRWRCRVGHSPHAGAADLLVARNLHYMLIISEFSVVFYICWGGATALQDCSGWPKPGLVGIIQGSFCSRRCTTLHGKNLKP